MTMVINNQLRLFCSVFLVTFHIHVFGAIAADTSRLSKSCERCLLLKRGTKINVKINKTISSKGDLEQLVDLTVLSTFHSDGQHLVFTYGLSGKAVAYIQKPRNLGQAAQIELRFQSIKTVDDQEVEIDAPIYKVSGVSKKIMSIGVGIGLPATAVLLGASPAFLAVCIAAPFIKGQHVDIPQEKEFEVEIARSVWVRY